MQNIFYINQRLELAPDDALIYLPSRLEDFAGENLVVAMPMRNSIPVYLPKNSPVHGKAITGQGSLYYFESSLLDYKMSPLPLWVIRKPVNIQQIQQRSFFRHPIHIPFYCYDLDEDDLPIPESKVRFYTENLSGGGALFTVSKNRYPMGTKIWLEIPLGSRETIKTVAKVMRLNIVKNKLGKMVFQVGLQFLDLEEATIKSIINFLNKKVLDDRNKGLL